MTSHERPTAKQLIVTLAHDRTMVGAVLRMATPEFFRYPPARLRIVRNRFAFIGQGPWFMRLQIQLQSHCWWLVGNPNSHNRWSAKATHWPSFYIFIFIKDQLRSPNKYGAIHISLSEKRDFRKCRGQPSMTADVPQSSYPGLGH